MNNNPNNDSPKRRHRIIISRSLSSKRCLVYEVTDGDVEEIIDGRRHKLSDTPSIKDKNKSKKYSPKSSAEVLKIMQSHGCPIKTPKERQMALDDYKRIQKTSRRKGLAPLREKETSSYAAISRDRLPKPGSGFKPLSSGLETNRRKH